MFVCLLNFGLLQDTTTLQVSIFEPHSYRIPMTNHHDTHVRKKNQDIQDKV